MSFNFFENPASLKSLAELADADVSAVYSETPTEAEIEAAIVALNTATPNTVNNDDIIRYTSPQGLITQFETYNGGGVIRAIKANGYDELDYTAASVPLEADGVIAPGTYFRVIASDGTIERFVVGPAPALSFISAPFENGSGGSTVTTQNPAGTF